MAGQKSFVPSGVSPSRVRKYFTLEQANRSLPLVRRIVTDIVATHHRISDLRSELADSHPPQAKEIESNLESALDRLRDLIEELSFIGCELKDFEKGLIDFISRYQGRDIYLCWRLGEERIAWWHELYGGFSGRQPIAALDPQ